MEKGVEEQLSNIERSLDGVMAAQKAQLDFMHAHSEFMHVQSEFMHEQLEFTRVQMKAVVTQFRAYSLQFLYALVFGGISTAGLGVSVRALGSATDKGNLVASGFVFICLGGAIIFTTALLFVRELLTLRRLKRET